MRRQSEQVIVWPCFVDVELAHVRSAASCYSKINITTEHTEALRAAQS
ncbi:hypothetical protein [Pseudoalteromonas sp. 10-33]|nr:hypothetical protein [Pseudoalteromonas sp. 10-33]